MEDPSGQYGDVRRFADQLAQLLVVQAPELNQEEERRLDGLLTRLHGDHARRPAVATAIRKIGAERQPGNRPNRHRIGAELMRIAGAVDRTAEATDRTVEAAGDTADVVTDTAEVVSDTSDLAAVAEGIAADFLPLLAL